MIWYQNAPLVVDNAGKGVIGAVVLAAAFGTAHEAVYSTVGAFPAIANRVPVGSAGVVRRMAVSVAVNTLDAPLPVTALVNGAPTAMTVTFGAGGVGTMFIDVPTPIGLTGEVSILFDASGAGGGAVSASASVEFSS